MSNTTTHAIRLRPVDKYFFGSETHHELDSRRQYFHRSNPWPQQTSLLGMIRHQLLLQEGLIPITSANRADASDLIGNSGFDPALDEYGVITGISPMMWLKDRKVYLLRSFDTVKTDDDGLQPIKVEWSKVKAKSLRGAAEEVPSLSFKENGKWKNWIAKTLFKDLLCNGTDQCPLDEIISDSEQVGIWKDRQGKPKEEGYFKFVYQTMQEDWAFVFQVTFKNTTNSGTPFQFDTTRRTITMGAEKSPFELEVLTTPVQFPVSIVAQVNTIQKVLLTSDAYVEDEQAFYNHVALPMCKATPFRHHVSTVSPRNYDDIPVRSQRYHLLKRGSVFYTENAPDLVAQLEQAAGFRTIGYNHYLIENI